MHLPVYQMNANSETPDGRYVYRGDETSQTNIAEKKNCSNLDEDVFGGTRKQMQIR
jgi:hypothetical protein